MYLLDVKAHDYNQKVFRAVFTEVLVKFGVCLVSRKCTKFMLHVAVYYFRLVCYACPIC